ncbi:MAG: PP0621 family protein [Ramlibacter sp.]
MKYLIVIAVVLLVLWSVRGNRRGAGAQASAAKPGNAALPQDMVQCPVCSVHLPRSDALPGPGGQLYCCAEHRQRAGS